MLSDDKLVEQIRLGNEEAAEELIKRYYTSILRYCKWHCSNLEKAEDLTQETFYKLFKNISAYKGKKKFKAYLYTIANRLCIDESRKTPFYHLEDEETTIDECNEILRLEDKAEINYLLNILSSEQREAIILRFGEQLSFDEIAKVVGCNMRTAQSRVRNGLKIMRKEQRNGQYKI
ncbi:MAG: RNA polymerase sigma factor [Lachnospiraceae bacterium]|nr:RNA polymerase sigma factor [Lachnospiraceae bacterium]